jgi:hypothetical protein
MRGADSQMQILVGTNRTGSPSHDPLRVDVANARLDRSLRGAVVWRVSRYPGVRLAPGLSDLRDA